jgi:integrase/recombinase XerC
LESFIADLRQRDIARATITSYWRALRAILEVIRQEDGVANPFLFLRTPRPGQARLKCLTPEAAERVLTFVQNEATVRPTVRTRNAAIVGTMLLAGVRKSELLNLRVSHVAFESRTVHVVDGKGRDGGKSRTVPMTPQLYQLLKAYSTIREGIETGAPEFYLGSHGVKALTATTLRRIFQRASSRTGIHVTPHMLRHTFCTLLSRFGVPDRLAREAMGHADFKTLQRYQHVYEGELAATMEQLALNIDVPR